MEPTLSIIIPTLDRCESLKATITSILRQDYDRRKYELIVVDNGSSDGTAALVQNFIAKKDDSLIRYAYEPEPGLLSGRHRGVFEARGSILIFTDDDVDWSPHVLSAVEKAFDDPSVSLVGGRNLPIYETDPPEWLSSFWQHGVYGKSCSFLSLIDFGDQTIEIAPDFVWGLNYSIRKSVLLALGGFNPELLPERLLALMGDGETGLSLKAQAAGHKAIYVPEAIVYHRIPTHRLTADYFQRRAYGQGISDSYTELRRDPARQQSSKRPLLLEYALRIRRRQQGIKAILGILLYRSILPAVRWIGSERQNVEIGIRLGFYRGYRFHRSSALRSKTIMGWIRRDHYLNYKLPDL